MKSIEIVTKNFFSKSAGLTLWPTKSKRVIIDGMSQTVDGSPIEFQNMGNGWGKYSTDDPEQIEFLERRMIVAKDVFDQETYIDKTTPPEAKLADAKRQITTQNKLIADYQRQLEEMRSSAGGASSRK